jgi:CheY-like chemotaxis protein
VARTFLEKWGAIIDVAVNGQQAVEMLNPEKHHIILMDMHMPVMDGYQAISAIREKGIVLPIVAITASLPAEVEERAQASGLKIDATVTKPFEPAAFLKIILRLLKHP